MIGGSCFISKIVEFCQMFIEPVLCSSNEDRQNCVGNA